VAEQTEGTIEIEARPEEIMAVIAEFEAYPEWAGVKSAEVVSRGDDGRGTEVAFEVSASGMAASYALAYTYLPGDTGISWASTRAEGAVRDITGEYVLEPIDGETRVTYRLGVELAMPVPGFLRRQAEKRIVHSALEGLKRRVEEA
jgi:carbon monoxide dehydrogenase subunit G